MNQEKVSSAEWNLKGAPNQTMELLPALMLQLLMLVACSMHTIGQAQEKCLESPDGAFLHIGMIWNKDRHDLEQEQA